MEVWTEVPESEEITEATEQGSELVTESTTEAVTEPGTEMETEMEAESGNRIRTADGMQHRACRDRNRDRDNDGSPGNGAAYGSRNGATCDQLSTEAPETEPPETELPTETPETEPPETELPTEARRRSHRN